MNRLLPAGGSRQSETFWLGCSFVITAVAYAALILAHPHALNYHGFTAIFPGFTAEELPPPGEGLVVTSLQTGSESQHDGIEVGDEDVALHRRPISSLGDAERLLRHHANDRIALHLLHNGAPREVVLHRSEGKNHGA